MSKVAPAVRYPIPAKPVVTPPEELVIPPEITRPIFNQQDYDGDSVALDLSLNFSGFSAFDATGLPDGFTINPVTGEISGTFTSDASQEGPLLNGQYYIEVTGSGPGIEPVIIDFTWVVLNRVPAVVTPIPDMIAQDGGVVNKSFAGYFADGGDDTDPLTFSVIGTLPPGLTMPDSSLGVISGTIDSNASAGGVGGVYTISIEVDDGQGGVISDEFLWTVGPIDIIILPPDFMINACTLSIVFVIAELTGPQLNSHTYLWEQLNAPPDEIVTFDTAISGSIDGQPTITLGYTQTFLGEDKTFRLWIDKGTGTEQFEDYFIISTPTSFATAFTKSPGGMVKVEDITDPILIAARQFDPADVSFEFVVDTSGLENDFDLQAGISGVFTWKHVRGSQTHDDYILNSIVEIRFQKFVGPGIDDWIDVAVFTDMEVDTFNVPVIEAGEEYRIASVYFVRGDPGFEEIFYTSFGDINAEAGSAILLNDAVISSVDGGIATFPLGGNIVRLNRVERHIETLYGAGPMGLPVAQNSLLRLFLIGQSAETLAGPGFLGNTAVQSLTIIRLNGISIGGG